MNNPMVPQPEIDLTGKTLGDFQVLRRLGQGGMGQVYLAEQISLKRKVALKLLKPELSASSVSLQRFKAEALAVARATHANIVQVYAVGEHENTHYMALEFVEGRSLGEFLEKKGPPDLLLGLSIMRQVAAALQRASELGIIHRDIKPDNILLTRKGEVKVADFGLAPVTDETGQRANLTQTGITMGTPLYMSPEQVECKPVDSRTDIYSFGVTCYHMFAGHPPFKGGSPLEVAIQHLQNEPQPLQEIRPDLPIELCSVINKMMAKQPENRYQTGREIVRDVAQLRDAVVGVTMKLGPALGDSASQIGGSQAITPEHTPITGKRWALMAASVLLALCAGLAIGWLRYRGDSASDVPPGSEADAKAVLAQKELEAKLRRRVEEHAHPGKLKELKDGLAAATDLAAIYFKNRRWQEANELFGELEKPVQPIAYQHFGKVGTALAMAFQDQAAESNKLFAALVEQKLDKPPPLQLAIRNNPRLAELVAQALGFNLANDPGGFPKKAEAYLAPPAATLRGAEK